MRYDTGKRCSKWKVAKRRRRKGGRGDRAVIEKERDKKQSISTDLFKKAFGSERADLVVSSFSVDDIHAAQDEPPEPW